MPCAAAFGLAAILAMLVGASAQQLPSTQPAVSIGVVRIDGTLYPIAQYRNSTWTSLIMDDGLPYPNGFKMTPAARALA